MALFDEIGYWSEMKLDIIRRYAAEYSIILSGQKKVTFRYAYIDAFAGSGKHISRRTGQAVPGSPQIALDVNPPFDDYYFIDIDGAKVAELSKIAEKRPNVHVFNGDSNSILLEEVFPKVRYEDFRRGLCLLDPYGLDLRWDVIREAGRIKTIDMFLNFPVMDINRNVLWTNPSGVDPADVGRMTSFWGDESWREIAYSRRRDLFGEEVQTKRGNRGIVTAFKNRLEQIAEFKYVPQPVPMRNSTGATVYYLFFASQNRAAKEIASYLFEKYRNWGTL